MGGNDDNFRRKFLCGMSRQDGSTRALSPKETITLDEYPTEPNVRLLTRSHRHCGVIYSVRSPSEIIVMAGAMCVDRAGAGG
jgi:hypothetical protein